MFLTFFALPAAGDRPIGERPPAADGSRKEHYSSVNLHTMSQKTENSDKRPVTLVEQVLTLQQKLVVPKNQENEEQKFNYRNIEDIVAAVKPLLADMGCILTFTEEIEVHAGARYVASTATITNTAGETISTKAMAREDDVLPGKCQAQITGSCISYARKYAIGGMLAIDAGKPSDIDSLSPAAEQPKKAETPVSSRKPQERPVLSDGCPEWDDEVLNVAMWKGTLPAYIADLRSRYRISDIDQAVLLAKRTAPFAEDRQAA